jgi:hypothetical protein
MANSFQTFIQIARTRIGRRGAYLFLICCLTIYLAAKGIDDEGIISPGGDMPRYMMNGVYFYDLMSDLPVTSIVQYTYRYFAKYPALSIGHHPMLPSLALLPFYRIFGISVFSARLASLSFFLLLTIMWFFLIDQMWDENTAFFSSLLLITNPFVVPYSRVVMSEISTLALIVTATYFLCRYSKTDQRKYVLAFVLTSALSVYAKHTAIFMFPFYLCFFLLTRGIKRLFSIDVLVSTIAIIFLIFPLVPLTLKFSQHNVSFTKDAIAFHSHFYNFLKFGLYRVLSYTWQKHFPIPLLLLGLLSVFISLYRKERREIIFLSWVVTIYIISVVTGAPSPRHVIFWIPPICLLAVATINLLDNRLWKSFITGAVIVICIYQFVVVSLRPVEYARGYEEAAEYILTRYMGDSVLYCTQVDTGFFIFFARKHDHSRNSVILRANKLLATSNMNTVIDNRITSSDEIYNLLNNYGVHYIVIEDKQYFSHALEMLQTELKTNSFVLKKKIPLRSSSKKLLNTNLCIYEYINSSAANPDSIVQINIPLMGENIRIPFSELINR